MLCDDLEVWEGGRGGREVQEGIHFILQQKLTQHCKAIILQLKKKHTQSDPPSELVFVSKYEDTVFQS